MPDFLANFDLRPRRGRLKPLPKWVREYFKSVARLIAIKHKIDPDRYVAMVVQESGADPRRVSSQGAIGIVQIKPEYHPKAVPDNPFLAMDYSAGHIANLVNQYGSYDVAFSVYNSGRPKAYLNPHFAKGETYNYVRNINAMSAKAKAKRAAAAMQTNGLALSNGRAAGQ